MTGGEAVLGTLIGFVSGVLSGLFGVGGGIVMTPGIQVLLGAPPIVALATPLPAIFPTAATGAYTYHRSGEVDVRAALWMAGPGLAAAAAGAALTDVVETHLLLVVTALLLMYQAVGILRGADAERPVTERAIPAATYAGIGIVAGFVSGLLGIGGGLVIVPFLSGLLGTALKRALGTSLLAIVVLVVPGTVVHAALDHIDWAIFAMVTIGAVPGARLGARIALGTRERTLRMLVGSFLLVVAVAYGVDEIVSLVRG
ncbi:MAG TPA: sulfite exporter TauE/SafE family protein [Actinomycetota bacterium]|jgi:hypothetical protein|nr:sulfite exporter TauE/SafE family protein [Actinomycetota bacterium]